MTQSTCISLTSYQVQPPPRASSQAPQTSKEPQTAQTGAVQGSGVISPGFMENGPLPSPSPTLNQQSIPPTENPEQLPDLGKFPSLRRRRKPKDKSGIHGVNTFHDSSMSDVEASGAASSRASPMQHTAAGPQWPTNQAIGAPGEESMRRAMQALHDAARQQNLRFVPPTLAGPSQRMPGQTPQPSHPNTASVPYASPYTGNPTDDQASFTIWPEHKKTSLAALAKQALESHPENVGKTISTDEIRSILDKNPSYNDLCRHLEIKGFKFERGEFARVLLSAVPEGGNKTTGSSGFPAVVKQSRQKPDDDSPRRPRGRPRKDGLPPRQHIKTQSPATNDAAAPTSSAPAPHTPQGNIPTGYSVAGPQHSATATQGDAQDQNLAAVLTSAISQIDGQSARKGAGTQAHTDSGPPLRRDAGRQLTAESLRSQNRLDPQTGRVIHPVAAPAPSVNGVHPEFEYSNQGPPIGHSQVQPNPSFIPRTQIPQHISASASVSTPKLDPAPTITAAKQQPKPAPLTKEQMAKKRDFSEIVDLAQESEEELTYQRKRSKLFLELLNSQNGDITDAAQGSESETQRGSETRPGSKTLPVPTNPSTSEVLKDSVPIESLPNARTAAAASKPNVDLSRFKAGDKGTIPQRKALRSADVVQELNKKHALKRRDYDPKTIVRDILITMGRHPTEKPLNWHLNGLRRNFRKVTMSSDLSTFRWDLVDPGGPILHPTAEEEDADDEADKEPVPTPPGLPGKTQPVPAVILPKEVTGTTREPVGTATAVNTTPADPLATTAGGNSGVQPRPTRGRPRGRPRGSNAKPRPHVEIPDGLVSQARPSRGSRGGRPPGAHLQPSFTHQSLQMNRAAATPSMAHDPHKSELSVPSFGVASPTKSNKSTSMPTENSVDAVLAIASPAPPTTLAVRVSSMTPSPLRPGETPQKRRGRPPGSTNKYSIVGSDHQRSTATDDGPRQRGRPPGSKTGTPTRGRPSLKKQAATYRTTIPSDGVGVMLPSRSPSTSSQTLSHVEESGPKKGEKKARGRPSNRATSPSFQVFSCRWQGCEAKLHNLETLRKHVLKLHGKKKKSDDDEGETEAKVPCLWSGCGQDGIFSSTSGPRRYALVADWKHHVEKKHLEAVAWELGDGPSAHPSGTVS